MIRALVLLIVLITLPLCAATVNPNKTCMDCHNKQTHAWQQSDHAKSMAVANKTTVLGDFNQQTASHHSQQATFSLVDGNYQVLISEGGKQQPLQIKYTFGHHPLQQYLVETEGGRLQVLPFSWDNRSKDLGGQRWYHNYADRYQAISTTDRLHWRQPLQNWNGMCADCHSDGLKRQYDAQKNSFNTTFDNINVGCVSCHQKSPTHGKQPKPAATSGKWLRKPAEKVAKWHGPRRDNQLMDTCFACHSLRIPLTDGFSADKPFLDQFTPQLPTAPNYYADGQIKEEVYVYGSFLQSKMFAAGVNCLDCHDRHTMKVKSLDNSLCLQCHSSEVYEVKKHHRHQPSSEGAQCVNCHMPQTRYMGVDDRRDHRFAIPKPDISLTNNSPNACVSCHQKQDKNQNNAWAAKQLQQWHGSSKTSPSKQHLIQLNSTIPITLTQHLAIVADEQLAVISRASALQMLPLTTESVPWNALKPYLGHDQPLLRLASANAAMLLPVADKVRALAPLLNDELLAVRVATARNLIDVDLDNPFFTQAFNALIKANEINSWRGEGRIEQGMIAYNSAYQSGDLSATEQAFKAAITIDPYLDAGYIQLADLYRSLQRPKAVAAVLQQGLNRLPDSAVITYALGLHFVRQQNLPKASALFEQAMILAPDNAQYAYTYILSLDGLGETDKALAKLNVLLLHLKGNASLLALKQQLSSH